MKHNQVKILIDPRARMVFASWYLKGMYDLFGRQHVKFSRKPFEGLEQRDDPEAFDHYMALLYRDGTGEKRVVIDFRDKDSINPTAWQWCEIYGKINVNPGNTDPKYMEKIVRLGPMIGINLWNRPGTLVRFLRNYRAGKGNLSVSRRYFLAGYTWQLRRPKLSEYEPVVPESDYIFFDSQLWTEENDAKATNAWRAAFIRTCKSLDTTFQGGLFANRDHPDYGIYEDLMLSEFITTDEYVRRIKRSTLVFNTPSCHHGHGWKLGEFLAMGKAMVSTPIINDLPRPLEHGKHLHLVENEEEIREAVIRITGDPAYRESLEQGAREYYNTYMTPSRVIRRLLGLT